MITRKLDDRNIRGLAVDICDYWDYLPDNLVVLYDLCKNVIQITTKEHWQKLLYARKGRTTDYEVTEQELYDLIRSKNGPDLPRNDEEEKIEPKTDEEIQSLQKWLSEHYNKITIIDDNIKICRNCYKTIDDDNGEYYHEYTKPDKDGLRYICGECYEEKKVAKALKKAEQCKQDIELATKIIKATDDIGEKKKWIELIDFVTKNIHSYFWKKLAK